MITEENKTAAEETAVNEEEQKESCNCSEQESEKASCKNKKEDKKHKKEIEALNEKIEKLENGNKELEDKYLRLVAEYDNFRKRSIKEKEGIYADAYADALASLLPVVDNLERAIQFSDGASVVEGVKLTLNQLEGSLEKMGVKVIETKTFDPSVHNAVMHVEDDAYGEGEIVEVFQKGYIKGDKVIRFAMVKVAN